jgi:hypothetical protein
MAHIILKQPNGEYSIYSTIVNGIVIRDMTELKLINFKMTEASDNAREKIKTIIDELNNNPELASKNYKKYK